MTVRDELDRAVAAGIIGREQAAALEAFWTRDEGEGRGGPAIIRRRAARPLAGEAIRALGLEIVPFDAELAQMSTALRQGTRALDLSLGDRACLALAQKRGVTADRAWQNLGAPIQVMLIR